MTGKDLARVMRIVTRLNVGGPARHALILNRELPALGFPSTLVSGVTGPEEGSFEPEGLDHVHVPDLRRSLSPVADLRAGRTIRRAIERVRPHIVHTHMAKAGTLGRRAAVRAGVPVVVHTFHGHVLEGYFGGPVTKAFIALERSLARKTDVLIAVSPLVRDELLALGIGDESQWRVVPLGLELRELLDGPAPPVASRDALGLPRDKTTVGIVGRLVPIKDHDTFFQAAEIVAEARPDVVFVVAGDGELGGALRARGKDLFGDRMRFLGWVHDLSTLYGALDIVGLSSLNEGTPVALIEAGAAGRPVVATAVGGVPDVVHHERSGLVVAPGDPAALAEAIISLVDDPERARSYGAEGRRLTAARYSADRLVSDVAALYRELLERKGVG